MYETQSSASSSVTLIIFIALILALGGFLVRRNDENKRARKAKRFETNRIRNNPRLALTDTYVYLIKRKRFPGKSYGSLYLKVGIGVEDRVRLQIREEETALIRLYRFSNREDAFAVEQKIIRRWNTKIRGEISTWHTSPGSEFISFTEKHLKQALKILVASNGTRVDGISENNEFAQEILGDKSLSLASADSMPEVLKRTQIYLMQNHAHSLIKVGIGNFNRPDHLKSDTWVIKRFGFFKSRSLARAAEKRVLDYWRLELKQEVPTRARDLLKSGYTETVEDSVGINSAWEIITNSDGFIPNLSDEDLELQKSYKNLIKRGKEICQDEEGWRKVMGASIVMRQTYLSNMFHYSKSSSETMTPSERRELTRRMFKYLEEFNTFTDQHKESLERIEKMSRWLPKDPTSKNKRDKTDK